MHPLSSFLAAALAISAMPAIGETRIKAMLLGFDGDRNSQVSSGSSIKIKLLDDDGEALARAIDAGRSGAMKVSRWTLQWKGNGGSESIALTDLTQSPSGGSRVSTLTAKLPADLGKADLSQTGWRLVISGNASSPALTVEHPDGEVEQLRSINVEVSPTGKDDGELIKQFKPLKPTLSFGGGEDGSIFGIEFSYRSSAGLTEDDQLHGMHARFEGSFTPDPDDALLMYGRYAGDISLFRTWRLPKNDLATGSLYFDFNTRFESDQQTDNYNWTLGTGVWGFIGFRPATLFSKGLYSTVNLGRAEMQDPPVLTTFLGYEHLVVSEHDNGTPAQGDDRLRFLVRYRTPLWNDVDPRVLPTTFDVDAVVDFSTVWDFDEGRLLPEVEAAVEFIPHSVEDEKLAFSISYVSGKIAPVFVDEDAFLAALKYRF